MEGRRNSEISQQSAEIERERKTEVLEVNERIGKLLGQIWDELQRRFPRPKSEGGDEVYKATLAFGPPLDPKEPRVQVDALDLNEDEEPRARQGRVLRSFNINFLPSGDEPQSWWYLSEMVEKDGTRFWPLMHEDEQELRDYLQKGGMPQKLDHMRVPRIEDMEKAEQVLKQCWEKLMAGRRADITYRPEDRIRIATKAEFVL